MLVESGFTSWNSAHPDPDRWRIDVFHTVFSEPCGEKLGLYRYRLASDDYAPDSEQQSS